MPVDEFSRRDIEFHRQTAAEYDHEITDRYAVYHRYLLEPYLDRLAARHGRARALDLGCGTGIVSLALARRGFDVVGVDHSAEMLAIAESKWKAEPSPRGSCTFAVGDVRALPFEDGAFAVVTCQGLLHHLADQRECLAELYRVLGPGGSFYISEPCRGETPLKRALLAVWHLKRLVRRPPASQGRASQGPVSLEEPIDADRLRRLLDELGVEYEIEFLTHLPPLQRALPERLYLLAVRAASAPWRRRGGDLLFVFGRKRGGPAASTPA